MVQSAMVRSSSCVVSRAVSPMMVTSTEDGGLRPRVGCPHWEAILPTGRSASLDDLPGDVYIGVPVELHPYHEKPVVDEERTAVRWWPR